MRRHDEPPNGFKQWSLCNSPASIVLSYADGTWTDRLVGSRVVLGIRAGAAVLTIEVSRGHRAAKDEVGDFLRKRERVESVQIARRGVHKRLREKLHAIELPALSVNLTAAGRDFVYPACAVFGPDAVTLNLG